MIEPCDLDYFYDSDRNSANNSEVIGYAERYAVNRPVSRYRFRAKMLVSPMGCISKEISFGTESVRRDAEFIL
jgi:hypothetical protein